MILDLCDGVKMALVRIPAGEFLMGAAESERGAPPEKPQHRVIISKDFHLGKYLVTQEEYETIVGSNPSWYCANRFACRRPQVPVVVLETRRFPVENVSWQDAQQFCEKLSESTGRTCRLPTEAEWEYACRAGTPTPFHFGVQMSDTLANANYALGRPCPVGSYSANPFGLFDMHGNVLEWCADYYGAEYYATSPPVDPKGPQTGHHRVMRGGSYKTPAWGCRSAARFASKHGSGPNTRSDNLGFRVVCVD
jgi:formylglycine-generating enzyme required for sulfatase activity